MLALLHASSLITNAPRGAITGDLYDDRPASSQFIDRAHFCEICD